MMDYGKIDLSKVSREELLAIIAQQAQLIAELQGRVRALEARLAKDSHNSHRPPSTDYPHRRTKSLRRPSGKKPGGQPGHHGQTLRLVDKPDQVIEHRPKACRACGTTLSESAPSQVERRQVVDLPPLRLEVTEHQVHQISCPKCGQTTSGSSPLDVAQLVQYGPRLQALVVYLLVYQLLPYDRTWQMLSDLFEATPSPGTFEAMVERCASELAESEAQIKQAITNAEVAHFDESGLNIEGARRWLHTAGTPKLTYYAAHSNRGKAATDDLDILPKFKGYAIHDAWSAYLAYHGCHHGLCNAHHLRDLTYLEEQEHQRWAKTMRLLLLWTKRRVDRAKAAGKSQLDAKTRQVLEERYRRILAVGFRLNPLPEEPRPKGQRGPRKQTKARNLLERFQEHQAAVLAFAYDFRVPFDNSLAERDIRMLKLKQKISGCFRSDHGAEAFCRIRGYLSTLRKQALPILAALERAFKGNPLTPALSPV
jgi:transposase